MDTITLKKHTTLPKPQPTENLQLIESEFDWLLDSPTLLLDSAHPALLDASLTDNGTTIDRKNLQSQVHLFYDMLRQRKSTRLGIRYETMWQYITRLNPSRTYLGSNIQVRGISKTLGEFDLLYFCHKRQQYVHQELAVKFYLGRPGSKGDWNDWLGPDHSDQLDKKLKRMFDQQIRLSSTEEGGKILCNLLGKTKPEPWLSEILLQGYLFYPWKKSCEPPLDSNPEHLKGDWLPLKQLTAYSRAIGADSFSIPVRYQWLALQDIDPEGEGINLSHLQQTLTELLEKIQRPVLAVAHTDSSNRLFFVAPDNWL
ncbi:DUF1853 family protein [Sansalvadorimonas sp. 2012CJ34-2]|uniref:DUF1853 family protein n=1 Tax=Parendozoicomonas callyspongiae TaxID=2942213 RepID=A0ABT0PL51_9GAMM|nr:DUF1853 family protein [Sansalvadorimonas sp. 2012CJ34-2]